ncbi:cytochrome p450 benzoate 4-monooxygenase [Xylaria flabelliformis]|nr:cytochrome p450 benzoate 4-monooxygenase [Xylaria flabelliformis]
MALLNPIILILFLPVWAVSYWVVPYFTTYKHFRHIPGPFISKFSNIWLAIWAKRGQRYAWGNVIVHAAHQRYGNVVRIGFNHVSIATPEGLRTVYAHGNGFLKDIFYDAFVPHLPDVFTVRDRDEHARKRKLITNAFSPGAVHDFEPYMAVNLERWVAQLDRIAASPGKDGYAKLDIRPWCTFLAFDIIGDLAFGAPFGMVERGRDEVQSTQPGGPATYVPGAESLNRRGQINNTLGWLPALRPWARYLPHPFFYKGLRSKANLHGIAVAAVERRLESVKETGTYQRRDILELLRHGKDAEGNPMPVDELVGEAHTQLVAGTDTVSNTSCAIIYWILEGERRNPGTILPRLLAELDAAIRPGSAIAAHGEVKNLQFLRLCIDESMRLHSTSAMGLPRVVTGKDGVLCENEHFPEGTVLSVPSYTLHHNADIWGSDVEEFKPERWLRATPQQKASFNPFSHGPRACVGQNVAHMEMALIIGTAFYRYDFKLYQRTLQSHEGFMKKPAECWVGIKLRNNKA